MGDVSPMGRSEALSSVAEITERILYWLSLDMQVRALAERLLQRFADTVGDLPASAKHHHSEAGGLHRHSLEVALKALEEFEGNIIMERRTDGSVDSFGSSRNRPRWQYATFIAALCHDLGKVFDLEVRGGEQRWCPLHQPSIGVLGNPSLRVGEQNASIGCTLSSPVSSSTTSFLVRRLTSWAWRDWYMWPPACQRLTAVLHKEVPWLGS